MAEKYFPLKVMDELAELDNSDNSPLKLFKKSGYPIVDEEDYIKNLFQLYCGKHHNPKSLYVSLMKTFYPFMNEIGLLDSQYIDNPAGLLTELYDFILQPYILNFWRKNKQVYKPDKDFCQALLKTENLVLTKDTINHIPCKHFYVDVSECDLFSPVIGLFVDILDIEEDTIVINVRQLSPDMAWTNFDFFNFQNEPEVKMNMKKYIRDDYDYVICDYDSELMGKEIKKAKESLTQDGVVFFVYQLITYLTSHEPQFEESQITKSTYRPPKKGAVIKNKFSEIQMHDIGIRFGKSFREQKRKYHCTTILTKHLEEKRKSPIPHFRSAHWQSYWIGKGRTERIVKWIEPIFVGGESNDVVIHKI